MMTKEKPVKSVVNRIFGLTRKPSVGDDLNGFDYKSSIMSQIAFNEDCNVGLLKYPDKSLYGVVDPPYGLGASRPNKKNKTVKQVHGGRLKVVVNNFRKKDWDDHIPDDSYFQLLERKCKVRFIFGANYFPQIVGKVERPPSRDMFDDFIERNPVGWIIWDKMNGNCHQLDSELIWSSLGFPSFVHRHLWRGMIQGSAKDRTVQEGNKRLNEKRIHPTQKPTGLYRWIYNEFIGRDETIVDTHMGSGSSRVAAFKEGRNYIGFENDEEFFESSCKWYDRVSIQSRMF